MILCFLHGFGCSLAEPHCLLFGALGTPHFSAALVLQFKVTLLRNQALWHTALILIVLSQHSVIKAGIFCA